MDVMILYAQCLRRPDDAYAKGPAPKAWAVNRRKTHVEHD